MSEPALSIVIPCLGHAEELTTCLRSLSAQSRLEGSEVIVVDSAWDENVAAAVSPFPFAKLIRSRDTLSPGAARNLGVLHTHGEGLAFLDADCIAEAGWVEQARAVLAAGHALAGGPVLDERPFHPIAWADNRLQFADFQAGRPAGTARYFPGCNMVMPRRIFSEAGGFVPDPLAGEDTLLCAEVASRYPGKLYFDPRLRVRHNGRKHLKNMLAHQRSLGYRRGHSQLHLDAGYRLLARRRALAGLVILRRLGYISLRTAQYDSAGLIRSILFMPWLIAGLVAWTAGFYEGYEQERNA